MGPFYSYDTNEKALEKVQKKKLEEEENELGNF